MEEPISQIVAKQLCEGKALPYNPIYFYSSSDIIQQCLLLQI